MARPKKALLSEIMGGVGKPEEMRLSHLPHILGEAMPSLPRNAVGRFRLVSALRQRFGDNFRALPGVSGLLKEFDDDIDLEDRIQKIKAIKYKPKRGEK